MTSEEERKRRSLEVTITHPDINNETENLENHARNFFSYHMKMDNRSVNANLKVHKCSCINSIRVTFSDVRFKRFIFSARKNPP